jgi:hypothetical protein
MMCKLLYVLLGVLLLGKPEAASACQMENPPSDEQLYAKASTVFVGRIFRTEEIEVQREAPDAGGSRTLSAVEATFRLVETLKGDPPVDRKIRHRVEYFNTCLRPLLVGFDYLIFLNAGSTFVVDEFDAGTRILFAWRIEDTYCQGRQCVLEKLRALGKKAQ